MKWLFLSLGLTASLFLFMNGCATAPKPTEEKAREVPDWVLNPPESDEQYMYFVGSGRSTSGDMVEAEEIARGSVIDEIMRYLGVRITSETTATAKASLDSFQTDLVQQLTSKASGRVTGLEMAERWVDKREDSLTLYLLARYNKADLLKEKQRLEEVFQEKIDAVAIPERKGKELAAVGQYYQAALRFIEAAAAAFKSEVENAEVKFERNINQAREAIRQIGLIKLEDNLEVYLGQEFSEPFRLKVVNGATAEDPGIAGVAIQAVYKQASTSGRMAVKSRLIKTDDQGIVIFRPPAPEFVGKETVSMSLSMSEALEPLQEVPDSMYEQVEGLEELILNKKVSFSFESISLAARIPTGVVIFNLDASGNPIALTDTSAGVLESMTQAGFQVLSLPVSVGAVVGRPDAQVIDLLRRNFQGQVQRAIFGTASISDHEQEGKTVIIQVTGSIKVADLETGKVLLSINRSKRAQGTNASAALSAAFKKLGEDIGKNIINQLR